MTKDGDDFLSSNDRQMWSIQQEIILRWGVYTIFKYQSLNVPKMSDGWLMWFVPDDVEEKDEIITWLEYELQSFNLERSEDFPGVNVRSDIVTFRGIESHVDRPVVNKMIEKIMDRFKKMMTHKPEGPQEPS